jgi:6-phosphogluconolactonase
MRIEVLADPDAVAKAAAKFIAAGITEAVAERGVFTLAVSGGKTPWQMLRALSVEPVPWKSVHVFQVDERVAPTGDADRNLTHLRNSLREYAPLSAEQIHPMPVEEDNLEAAATKYSELLKAIAGSPSTLDLVHLGLGPDGHTASLVPGDPVLEIVDRDVAVTNPYQGRKRMTLTYPILNRARRVLWLVTGADKALMVRRLKAGDTSIPAGRVRQEQGVMLADRDAAGSCQ